MIHRLGAAIYRILLPLLLAACISNTGETSTDPDVMVQEIGTLQAQLADLQTAAEATD